MTLEGILALDLILDVKIWSIKLLMGRGLNMAHTLGVTSGTLYVRDQCHVSWSYIEYAPRTEEYAQHTRLGRLGQVGSVGLTRLAIDLTFDR